MGSNVNSGAMGKLLPLEFVVTRLNIQLLTWTTRSNPTNPSVFSDYIFVECGILAIDESNATCGKRLASIGLDNIEANRQAYIQLLLTTPGLGQYISGSILFEETLFQSTTDGKKMVDCLREQNIVPGIKVDKVEPNER
ncbi:hypothetical protein E3N88_01219 [Mikania micrantha]|uniref:fructose-bisphosphate aldolase n=1 Tax=Mikania micrantha TaxID=192012 RepID=A0A5N6Q113_9ASTR|nr:hypothetical protein E3N88_01219 [Mikania micrantha]